MKAFFSHLLFVILLCTLLLSCKKNAVLITKVNLNHREIEMLIEKGILFQSANVDSLPPVSMKLSDIAKISGDKEALVYSEVFNAEYFWLSSKHEKSMEGAVRSLADAEKWSIKGAYPIIYGLIANLHKENANYKLAFEEAGKELYWARANKDTENIIASLGLKAMLVHTYQLLKHTGLNDSSINLEFDALKIAESNKRYYASCTRFYDNIAQYYLDNKYYDKAIYYGEKGVENALKYNQQRSLTYSYSWLGEAFYYKNDTLKGLNYLNKALTITRMLKEPYREMEIYNHLFDCYYFSKKYERAIAVSRRHEKMYDSLQVRVNEKQISELQIKYETAKKDKELAVLDHSEKVKNRQIVVILISSLLLAVFLIVLYLQYHLIRRSNRLMIKSNSKKDEALEHIAFIQSHELRKPLASIMGLINVIKTIDEIDHECLLKLEEASRELDEKIHNVIAHAETKAD